MVFSEMTALERLNENCEVYDLLLRSIDFRQAKLHSIACLQLFRVLFSRAPNSRQVQCERVVFKIYNNVREFVSASRRNIIFTALCLQLHTLVTKYSGSPKFALIVARLHPELLDNVGLACTP